MGPPFAPNSKAEPQPRFPCADPKADYPAEVKE
jgi:hypothetical protein